MSMCVHIGIDAQGNVGHNALSGCQLVDDFKFGHALYVETEDASAQGGENLLIALANSCINDFLGGESCIKSGLYFSTTHAVCAKTSLGYQSKQARIGICLDCIMHLVMSVVADGFADGAERLLQNG